jgi:hypothetical protein
MTEYAMDRENKYRQDIEDRYNNIKPSIDKEIKERKEENSKYVYRDMTEEEKLEAYKKAEVTMPYDRHQSFEDWCYIESRDEYGLKIRIGVK